jgi:hypothetical protein
MASLKHLKLLFALMVFTGTIVTLHVTSHQAIDTSASAAQQERQLENLIPKHVPLKIRIKKEKERLFKNLGNERWAHDFELEVTNIGERPIYEFYLKLVLDVKGSDHQDITAPVYYGRAELGDLRVRATADDDPLDPGESCILKIHPGQLGAWDIARREDGRPHPTKLRITFIILNFGDGTGLVGPDAEPLPRKAGKQSALNQCAGGVNQRAELLQTEGLLTGKATRPY